MNNFFSNLIDIYVIRAIINLLSMHEKTQDAPDNKSKTKPCKVYDSTAKHVGDLNLEYDPEVDGDLVDVLLFHQLRKNGFINKGVQWDLIKCEIEGVGQGGSMVFINTLDKKMLARVVTVVEQTQHQQLEA